MSEPVHLMPCADCGIFLPMVQMCSRLDTQTNVVVYRCPQCGNATDHRETERKRRLRAKERAEDARSEQEVAERRQALSAIIGALGRQRIEAPHISELNESLIKRFGGLEQFATFYYEQIMAAAAQHPGGRSVLSACAQIARIMTASTQHRQSAPDVQLLSDQDLERELLALAQYVRGQPPQAITQEREGAEDAA